MRRKSILISIIIVFIIILTILIINQKKEVQKDSKVNLEDGLQKEELESLTVDDFRKINSPSIYNLGLDEVDNNYYYKMIEMPGVYKEHATREEREKIYLYYNDLKAVALEMCKKNGDWSLINNSDRYGEYNQEEGLLKGFEYNSLESGDWNGDSYSGYVDVIAKNEKEERKYRISIYTEDGTISYINVKLGEIKQIDYSKNIELDKVKFDKEHTEENFNYLCFSEYAYKGGLDWNREDIAISENMYSKYPYFLDLFIHYSPLEYNKITLKDLDIDNQIATFEVDSVLECKKRTYKVKYILDDNLYLDDVEVEMIKEEEVDLGKPEKQAAYWIYKNSDWSKLKLTNDFNDKFNSFTGVFKDLNIIKFDNESIASNRNYIYRFVLDNNSVVYYFLTKSMTSQNEIDDIVYKKLPYDSSMTLEEVRDAFLADKDLQKELGIEIS